MSLIICPSCKNKISDKASECLHCGLSMDIIKKELTPIKEIICDECGQSVPETAPVCPNCGNPLIVKDDNVDIDDRTVVEFLSSEEQSLPPKKKNGFIKYIAVCAAIVALIVVAIVVKLQFFPNNEKVSSKVYAAMDTGNYVEALKPL